MNTRRVQISSSAQPLTIAIIGGGASGALTAFHLSLQSLHARIVLLDPTPQPALGLAYSTPSLEHRLNVPVGKISALPSQPDHFLQWLEQHHAAYASRDAFAPRAVFGQYLRSIYQQADGVAHRQSTVTDLQREGSRYRLTLQNGEPLDADVVVLALGNFDPASLPGIDPLAVKRGEYFHNAWSAEAYRPLQASSSVTLVGSGLTAVDVLLRLREQGFKGTIHAVSRHGVLPYRHAPYQASATAAIPLSTEPTCLAYLRALRSSLQQGMAWRAAIDSLRATTNDLWLRLPVQEQRRFRRHLQRRWDVVRHRMAPPIADRIDAELAAGTLVLHRGRLHSVEARAQGVQVMLRDREGTHSLLTGRVINCTGPSMDYRKVDSPLLRQLFRRGLVSAGALGNGLNSTPEGALIDATGRASTSFYHLGPSRLGTLLESIAIPEIREQAAQLAGTLSRHLSELASAVSPAHWVSPEALPAVVPVPTSALASPSTVLSLKDASPACVSLVR